MLNKYRILLYIVISLITTNIIAQTKNYQWLLVDALAKDDFFKACEYKNVCGDTIAKSLDIFYQYKMYGYLNKPDSSAICLEKVLKEYPDFFSAPQTKFAYLNILIELWQNCENYEKLLEAYNMAEHLISTTNAGENWTYQQFAILKQLKVEAQKK